MENKTKINLKNNIHACLAYAPDNLKVSYLGGVGLTMKVRLGLIFRPWYPVFLWRHPVLGRYPDDIFSPTPFHGMASCPEFDTCPTVAMHLGSNAISCFEGRRSTTLSPRMRRIKALDPPALHIRPPSPGIFSMLCTTVPIGRAPRGWALPSTARTEKDKHEEDQHEKDQHT